MLKNVRLSDYQFPYVILVSKICNILMLTLMNGSLVKMGFVKVNNSWVIQKEDFVGTSAGPSGIANSGDGA